MLVCRRVCFVINGLKLLLLIKINQKQRTATKR